jgi:hypothetical protein
LAEFQDSLMSIHAPSAPSPSDYGTSPTIETTEYRYFAGVDIGGTEAKAVVVELADG